jgi:hypothetical protein
VCLKTEIKDDLYKQNYLISGVTFLPTRGVALKFDWKPCHHRRSESLP